jgi:hypothetical protein
MSPILGIYASQISGHLFTLSGSYDALASVTVPSGGLSSVTFAGIPTGYSHLQIRGIARGTASSEGDVALQFNGDTGSNYSNHQLYGSGSSVGYGGGGSNSSSLAGFMPGANATTGVFGALVYDILDYASTNKNKTIRCLSGFDNNGTPDYILLRSSGWFNTSAVSSINLFPASNNFAQYSQFSLYGVK